MIIFDSSVSEQYHVPLRIQKGAVISVSGYFGGASPTGYVTFVGISDPDDISLSAGVPLVPLGYTSIPNTDAWTVVGSVLASVPVRKIISVSSNFGAQLVGNYDLGFGPSATSVSPLITGIPYGTENVTYNNRKFDFKTDFDGTGNYLYARTSGSNLYISPFYFY
jgi:hypothetical protein